MDVQPDFRELLELFNAHRVDFIVVGGYALARSWRGEHVLTPRMVVSR
jgi:hypothetical protein